MHLPDPDLLDAGFVPAFEPDIPPDPAVRKPWPPVPSKHAVRFAQMRESPHCFIRAAKMVLPVCLTDKTGRGKDRNLQDIFAGTKNASHIKLPGDVHVVCPAEHHTIQPYFRKRVNSLKAKNLMGTVQNAAALLTACAAAYSDV
jgi:hypothetical protein